jgi:hypothetical protein
VSSHELTRPRASRRGLLTLGTGVGLALVLCGCGSSGSGPKQTTRHSASTRLAPGWHVVSTKTFAGRHSAVIGGTVRFPAAIKVEVSATPQVVSQIDYSIDCEKSGTHPVSGTIDARRTPLTAPIPVTPNAAACFVDVTASKSVSSSMTIKLLVDVAAARTA